MELSTFATYVGLVRDFLLLTVGLLVLVMVFVIYRKVSKVLRSVRRTAKAIEEATSMFSTQASGPARAGMGIVAGIGKAGSFLWRLIRRRRTGEDEDE